MAYENIYQVVDNYITENGANAITGPLLNNTLDAIISTFANEQFGGIVKPASTFTKNSNQKWFFFASEDGTYTNYGGIILESELCIITYDGVNFEKNTLLDMASANVVATNTDMEEATNDSKFTSPLKWLHAFSYHVINYAHSGFNTTVKTIQGAINQLDAYFKPSNQWTGNIRTERVKYKPNVTNTGASVTAGIDLISPSTSFEYKIKGINFKAGASNISAYFKTATLTEGQWIFYIDSSTTNQDSPVIGLTNDFTDLIMHGHVLLYIIRFNATDNTIDDIQHEKHAFDRDLNWHRQQHKLGALYESGFEVNHYNGLTNAQIAANTNNNFGRAMNINNGGIFYDEDLKITIAHAASSINSTLSNPSSDFDGTTYQYLGEKLTAITGTNTTTIVFTSETTLITGQPVLVFSSLGVVRGTTTVTTGATGTSFTVATLAGMTTGDIIYFGGKRPICHITAVSNGVYTWRKLTSGFFGAVMSGAIATTSNIASGVAQTNNPTTGGFDSVTANRYYCLFEIETNNYFEPVRYILSQGFSSNNNLATALTENFAQYTNLVGLQNLGVAELVITKRLTYIYNTTAQFTNCRCKLVDVTAINTRIAINSSGIGSSSNVVAEESVTNTPRAFLTGSNQRINNILINEAFIRNTVINDLGTTGGTIAIDSSLGLGFKVTINANSTFEPSNMLAGFPFYIEVKGNFTAEVIKTGYTFTPITRDDYDGSVCRIWVFPTSTTEANITYNIIA